MDVLEIILQYNGYLKNIRKRRTTRKDGEPYSGLHAQDVYPYPNP